MLKKYYIKKIRKMLLKDYAEWFVNQELDLLQTTKQARAEYKRLKKEAKNGIHM